MIQHCRVNIDLLMLTHVLGTWLWVEIFHRLPQQSREMHRG